MARPIDKVLFEVEAPELPIEFKGSATMEFEAEDLPIELPKTVEEVDQNIEVNQPTIEEQNVVNIEQEQPVVEEIPKDDIDKKRDVYDYIIAKYGPRALNFEVMDEDDIRLIITTFYALSAFDNLNRIQPSESNNQVASMGTK